jgi:hypothetical protein
MLFVEDSNPAKVTRMRTMASPSSVEVSIGSVTLASDTPAFSQLAQNRSNSAERRTRRSSFHTSTPSTALLLTASSKDS